MRSTAASTLSITLAGGELWQSTVGLNDVDCILGERECASIDLLRGLTSAQHEAAGWEAVLGAGLTYLDIERFDDHTVHINLGPFPRFFITAPQTLNVEIPQTALRSQAPLALAQTLAIAVNETNGRPILGGSFLHRESLRETSVQLEELELLIKLSDDAWVEELSDSIVRELALGISASSAADAGAAAVEAFGWESVVQPAISSLNVTRVNDTVLSITFRNESYDVERLHPELLTVTVPPSAVLSSVAQQIEPSLQVEPVTCTASVGGSLAADAALAPYLLHVSRGSQEKLLRGINGTNLIVRLSGCTFRRTPSGRLVDEELLLRGLRSSSDEPAGFNAIVLAALAGNVTGNMTGNVTGAAGEAAAAAASALNVSSAVSMINASAVMVTVPSLQVFDIAAPETASALEARTCALCQPCSQPSRDHPSH